MAHLKASTEEAHRQAETRPLMRSIAQGTVGRDRFVAHLEQLLLVHRALDPAVQRAVTDHPSWSGIAAAERGRVADLEADLKVLGGSLAPASLPATTAMVTAIAKATPLQLLGMFYVTEGSTNGGRFLAKRVARTLGLDPVSRDGLRALDPYGERQPELWAAFKSAMNGIGFEPNAIRDIEAGARAMFDQLGSIADAVQNTSPV
jgi:heme oxygenase